MRGQLRGIPVVGVLGIVDVNRDDLVVRSLVVAHGEHADGAGTQDAERNDRLLAEDEHVKWVAVAAVGPRQESIVGGIVHRGVEYAIQPEQTGLLVELVLHLGALWNLDHAAEVLLYALAQLDLVPRIHGTLIVRGRLAMAVADRIIP